MTEREDLAEIRAREVARLLSSAGIDAKSLTVSWSSEAEPADGVGDWHSRITVVRVEP